jgi:uncharacterized membrane protein
MGQFIDNLQYKIKATSGSLLLISFKIFCGFVLGLTFALAGQQMIGYGTFAFVLVIIAALSAFYRVARSWLWSHTMVFALVCVLLVLLLQMYIQVAPGA